MKKEEQEAMWRILGWFAVMAAIPIIAMLLFGKYEKYLIEILSR